MTLTVDQLAKKMGVSMATASQLTMFLRVDGQVEFVGLAPLENASGKGNRKRMYKFPKTIKLPLGA